MITLVTTMQLQLLKSAREDGLIPFPAGSAAAVRRALGELEILESQGCVETRSATDYTRTGLPTNLLLPAGSGT